jgi:hypothetical protein
MSVRVVPAWYDRLIGVCLLVTCNNCGKESEVSITALRVHGLLSESGLESYLGRFGWITDGDLDFCSGECQRRYCLDRNREQEERG